MPPALRFTCCLHVRSSRWSRCAPAVLRQMEWPLMSNLDRCFHRFNLPTQFKSKTLFLSTIILSYLHWQYIYIEIYKVLYSRNTWTGIMYLPMTAQQIKNSLPDYWFEFILAVYEIQMLWQKICNFRWRLLLLKGLIMGWT